MVGFESESDQEWEAVQMRRIVWPFEEGRIAIRTGVGGRDRSGDQRGHGHCNSARTMVGFADDRFGPVANWRVWQQASGVFNAAHFPRVAAQQASACVDNARLSSSCDIAEMGVMTTHIKANVRRVRILQNPCYFVIVPQMIRSPAAPPGSVFMSSAAAWIISAVPPLV